MVTHMYYRGQVICWDCGEDLAKDGYQAVPIYGTVAVEEETYCEMCGLVETGECKQ